MIQAAFRVPTSLVPPSTPLTRPEIWPPGPGARLATYVNITSQQGHAVGRMPATLTSRDSSYTFYTELSLEYLPELHKARCDLQSPPRAALSGNDCATEDDKAR